MTAKHPSRVTVARADEANGPKPPRVGMSRGLKISERVAHDLAQRIILGDHFDTVQLPTERELTEYYEVGRSTIREALRLLETRGVVEVRPGRGGGPRIRRPDPADLGDAMSLLFQFEGARLSDVIEARHAIEPVTAALAAERATPAAIEALRSSVEAIREHPDDPAEFALQNERFHLDIATASGSTILRVLVEALRSISDGQAVGVEYTIEARLAVAGAHDRIIDAIANRDSDAAAAEMLKHLDAAGRYWKRNFDQLWQSPIRWTNSRG